ncbi:MAG TPA: hypothetical protein VJ813_04890 [Vicinamibacterales bacterium]|nr:hypothetical protein [Vicinamibacterales bacterium]
MPQAQRLEDIAAALTELGDASDTSKIADLFGDGAGLTDLLSVEAILKDTFLSFVLAPDPGQLSLETIARYLRVLYVGGLHNSGALSTIGSLATVLNAPILLPAPALAPSATRPWPVGFADLLVVKQHILGYERGEVARIENVLRGETRKHTLKHTLSNEREATRETEKGSETSEERTTSERSKLSAEVERQLKEQWNVKAGLEVGYGKEPSFFIRANVGLTYDRMTQESAKFATDVAKDITTKAASRVSERVREVERVRVIEAFEDVDEQGFENKAGGNVSGVYQFVDKVYRCRTYSYGKRWLMDFVIPEPAAFLHSARAAITQGKAVIQRPLAMTDNGNEPTDSSNPGTSILPTTEFEYETAANSFGVGGDNPFYYARLAARYGVTDLQPLPPVRIEVSKSFSIKKTDESYVTHAEDLTIPPGYAAKYAMTLGNWHGDNPSDVNIFVGDVIIGLSTTAGAGPFYKELAFDGMSDKVGTISGTVPVAISGHETEDAIFNLVLVCELTDPAKKAWRQRTYDQILARYTQLMRDYEDKVAANAFLRTDSSKLGRTPSQNRLTEKLELKRSALSILEGATFKGFDQILEPSAADPAADAKPAPDVADSTFQEDMARIQFLEQAFEWENMSYSLYPYFHGRPSRWKQALARVEDDAQFESFLNAGAARVVIAIRPGFAEDVFYYLATGLVWSGVGVPVIGDPRYVPIVDELRQQAGAGAPGEPYGDDWELRLATNLVTLRSDDTLPAWKEIDRGAVAAEPRSWVWAERES